MTATLTVSLVQIAVGVWVRRHDPRPIMEFATVVLITSAALNIATTFRGLIEQRAVTLVAGRLILVTGSFAIVAELESVTVGQAYETSQDGRKMPQLRLAERASDTMTWPNLGYADAYAESFAIFDRLQQDGTIAAGVRFQMQYLTPLASMAGTIVPEGPAERGRLLREGPVRRPRQGPGEIAARPLRGAVGRRGRVRAPGGGDGTRLGTADRAGHTRVGPLRGPRAPEVPVGLHFCYGDYGDQHFKQPESLRMQVDLVTAVVSAARRVVNWASFTVPQDRGDAGYFARLRDLAAGPDTEPYFALVPYHPGSQADGTTAAQSRHIDTALAESSAGPREWDGTECGMVRVAADNVPTLLDPHREILSA